MKTVSYNVTFLSADTKILLKLLHSTLLPATMSSNLFIHWPKWNLWSGKKILYSQQRTGGKGRTMEGYDESCNNINVVSYTRNCHSLHSKRRKRQLQQDKRCARRVWCTRNCWPRRRPSKTPPENYCQLQKTFSRAESTIIWKGFHAKRKLLVENKYYPGKA